MKTLNRITHNELISLSYYYMNQLTILARMQAKTEKYLRKLDKAINLMRLKNVRSTYVELCVSYKEMLKNMLLK